MPKYKKEHIQAVRKVARAKFAGNGMDHLKMMLGGDKPYRNLILLRRNLMGATGASTETANVLMDAIYALAEELEMKPNVLGALNKMKNIADRGDKMSFDMLRNQIFKTADLLKVKLPSMMFASSKTARLFVYDKSSDIELFYDPFKGTVEIGMGGEWWGGPVKVGKNVYVHPKERMDPAYRPVTVHVASVGHKYRFAVAGGFGGGATFMLGFGVR